MKKANQNTITVPVFTAALTADGIKVTEKTREYGIPKNVVDVAAWKKTFLNACIMASMDTAAAVINNIDAKAAKAATGKVEYTADDENRKECAYAIFTEYEKRLEKGYKNDKFLKLITYALFPVYRRCNGKPVFPVYGHAAFTAVAEYAKGINGTDKTTVKKALDTFANEWLKVEKDTAAAAYLRTFTCKCTDEMLSDFVANYKGTKYRWDSKGISKNGMQETAFIADIILAYLAHTFKFAAAAKVDYYEF